MGEASEGTLGVDWRGGGRSVVRVDGPDRLYAVFEAAASGPESATRTGAAAGTGVAAVAGTRTAAPTPVAAPWFERWTRASGRSTTSRRSPR